MPLSYYFVSLIACLLFMVCLAKIDRDNKMNYCVFCTVAALGAILICLCLRAFVFVF